MCDHFCMALRLPCEPILGTSGIETGCTMWNWICCYVTGHDYAVCCDGGSIFLRCFVCGRRSHGWDVHGHHAAKTRG